MITKWAAGLRVSRVLVRDTAVMYGAAVASGLVQYATLVILARSLGPSGLGTVVLATVIGSFAVAAVEFGIGPVLIRFRPQLEDADPELWSAVVRSMARIVCGATFSVLCVGTVALLLSVTHFLFVGTLLIVAWGAAVAAPTVLLTFFQNYLQSDRRFGSIGILSIGAAGLRLILTTGLLVVGGLTARTALATYVAVACLTALVAWMISLRRARLLPVTNESRARARVLARPYLRWTMVGRSCAALNGSVGIFLLSGITGTQQTGIYGAASQSASPFSMLASAVGEVSFPHLVLRTGGKTNWAVLTRWVTWLPLFAIGGLILGAGGAYILPMILGARFGASSAPFATLAIAYSLTIWLQPIGAMLYASGRQVRAAWIAVGQLALQTTLTVVLIPSMGALGLAVAILITVVASGPLLVMAALRRQDKVAEAPPSTAGATLGPIG
jgi:O-antigen/teichoic acid export membrane protein